MLQNGKKDPVLKKAYEIAYALCRIGDGIKNEAFGKILTQKGVELLCAAVNRDNGRIADFISGLEYLIQFGASTGYLGQSNVDTLLAELVELLNAVAAEEMDRGDAPVAVAADVDVSDIFSSSFDAGDEGHSFSPLVGAEDVDKEKWFDKKGIRIIESEPVQQAEIPKNGTAYFNASETIEDGAEVRFIAPAEPEIEDSSNGGFSASISSDVRQSAILNRIRQSGNCRIRDLQNLFPKWSERTLRYDVETLISKKLVERVGAASATYYRPVPVAG